MRGDDVERLQHNLSLLGLYYGHLNGAFEEKTHLAVLELQQSLGLERSGRVDHRTIEALAGINKNITNSKAFSLRDFHNLESANGAVRSHRIILVPSAMIGEHPSPAEAPLRIGSAVGTSPWMSQLVPTSCSPTSAHIPSSSPISRSRPPTAR